MGLNIGKLNGFDLKANMIGGDVGPFHFKLGVGLSTVVGVKDDSFQFKVGGVGIQVGRKMGFSVFDNEVGFDIKNFF